MPYFPVISLPFSIGRWISWAFVRSVRASFRVDPVAPVTVESGSEAGRVGEVRPVVQ